LLHVEGLGLQGSQVLRVSGLYLYTIGLLLLNFRSGGHELCFVALNLHELCGERVWGGGRVSWSV